MRKPGLPENEAERLASLHAFDVLDTLPEANYDDIVSLAAQICGVPVALISLVDEKRQWFKARVGLDATETPRDISFCGHVVESSATLVVGDAAQDERFADNPLVSGDPRIRFYAGAPLRDAAGHSLGTLCVIDRAPRELRPQQLEQLESLSRLVVALLEQRIEVKKRAAAQEALAAARLMQQRFFDLSLDMLCVAGFDGFFKHLNPAFSETLGFTDEELKSRPFMEFVHPDDHDSTTAVVRALGERTGQLVNFENRFMKKDSSDYCWLRWSATFDPDSDTMFAGARDVTEERLNGARLHEALNAAEVATRAKSAFLTSMSHELRTPLNSVIGFTNLLAKNKRDNLNEEELLYLQRISANGRHLLSLINDVLDISRIEGAGIEQTDEVFDIGELVREVVGELQGAIAGARNNIRVDIPDGLTPLAAVRRRLKQVVINLVGNANKFTQRGEIAVRVRGRNGCPAWLEVADTGPGIDAANLGRIFEAFQQADAGHSRAHGGTGLGLSISKSLCDAMQFELGVLSELGNGSTFFVAFDPMEAPPTHIRPTVGTAEAP